MSEVDVTGSYRKSPALLRLLLLTAAICFVSTSVRADALHDRIVSDVPSLISLYRDLHAHPELSMNEIRTSSMLATEARKAGFSVTEHVGQTGVVAVLANGPGPVLLIRADMDALPVREDTGLQFASKAVVKGPNGEDIPVAHACGHDTHMATWVETARALAGMRDQWSGTLVMILQPGEETTVGAKEMLDSGLYSRFPKPQYVMAFHDSASLPAGMIGITTGPATANVDSVDIIVHGIGGHGAVPQAAKDPIVLAARIVGTLQTLISRDLDPQEPAVVTVGSFHAGSTRNIIPDEATLLLTVRSYSDRARTILLDGIGRIARGEAIAAGVPEDRMPTIKVDRQSGTPATVNTEPLTSQMTDLFASRFGEDRVEQIRAPMIGEDFSRYGHDDPSIQSFFFWVGGVPNDKWRAAGGDITKLPSLHSAKWAPDAATVIQTASEGLASAALQILKKAH